MSKGNISSNSFLLLLATFYDDYDGHEDDHDEGCVNRDEEDQDQDLDQDLDRNQDQDQDRNQDQDQMITSQFPA